MMESPTLKNRALDSHRTSSEVKYRDGIILAEMPRAYRQRKSGPPANGNPGELLEAAGFNYHFLGLNLGSDEYRSPGQPGTGSNSGHFNVWQVTIMNPLTGVLYRLGDMHFGETNPFTGSAYQHLKEWWQ